MSKGLEALKAAWAKAKQDSKEFSNPVFNDGHYVTKIIKAEVGQSKKGTDQITMDFEFVEGEYTGKHKRTWMGIGIDNPQGLAITIGTLDRLGLHDVEPETLEDDLRTLLGKLVRIQLVTTVNKKTDTEYQNVRIEKVLGVDPDSTDMSPVEEVPAEPEAEAEAVEEPELPKAKAKSKKSKKGSEEPEVEEEVEAEEEEAVEEAPSAEEEEGVEITKGMKVAFLKKDGTELSGTIDDIDEDEGKVVILAKDVDGKSKKFRVEVDRVSAL